MEFFNINQILSILQTLAVMGAAGTIVWKIGRWTGAINNKLTNISSDICAMRKVNEKQWETMSDHSTDIARLQGRINGFAACSNFAASKDKRR